MQFQIDNMTCGGCVRRVTAAVQSVDSAATVTANVGEHRVDIQSTSTQQAFLAALESAGYPAKPVV
ncbi:heavy-metal-associated domain-containing protein [Advenella sp. FME57]|uniref:heavy-metal-associated domain-containing protein n=1 Tax=Advenella sp. FME57 TaxID=2742604 RepID=UPI0018660C68|nr:heavy-metal-associated domain-containing protein [Advenella sp. FME57]